MCLSLHMTAAHILGNRLVIMTLCNYIPKTTCSLESKRDFSLLLPLFKQSPNASAAPWVRVLFIGFAMLIKLGWQIESLFCVVCRIALPEALWWHKDYMTTVWIPLTATRMLTMANINWHIVKNCSGTLGWNLSRVYHRLTLSRVCAHICRLPILCEWVPYHGLASHSRYPTTCIISFLA